MSSAFTPYTPPTHYTRHQLVIARDGKVYKITKVNPKNLLVVDELNSPWRMDKRGVKPAPEGTEFALKVEAAVIQLGTVVRFTGDLGVRAPGLWVCVKAPNGDRGHFAPLNGGTMVWKVYPGSCVTVRVQQAFDDNT